MVGNVVHREVAEPIYQETHSRSAIRLPRRVRAVQSRVAIASFLLRIPTAHHPVPSVSGRNAPGARNPKSSYALRTIFWHSSGRARTCRRGIGSKSSFEAQKR